MDLNAAMDQIYKFQNMIKRNGNGTKFLLTVEILQNLMDKKKTVYKTYNVKENKIITVRNERCLAPIWSQITYIWRGVKSVTIEAQFENGKRNFHKNTQKMKK